MLRILVAMVFVASFVSRVFASSHEMTSSTPKLNSRTATKARPLSDGEIRRRLAQAGADAIQNETATPIQRLQEQLGRGVWKTPYVPRTEAQPQVRSWTEVAKVARRSTLILAGVHRPQVGSPWEVNTSTAFLIGSDGTFVTCRHVFLHDEYQVMLAMTSDGRISLIREILASNEEQDVAIGKLEGTNFPALSIREDVQVGEEIGIMSHPHGQFFTFSRGAVTRDFDGMEDGRRIAMFAVDADFGPGSSGAPVLDRRGRVLGMAESMQMRMPRSGAPASFNPPMIFRHCRPSSSWMTLIQAP